MIKTTQYTERYRKHLWKTDQIGFAELSYCYKCCVVASKKECVKCSKGEMNNYIDVKGCKLRGQK